MGDGNKTRSSKKGEPRLEPLEYQLSDLRLSDLWFWSFFGKPPNPGPLRHFPGISIIRGKSSPDVCRNLPKKSRIILNPMNPRTTPMEG
ncbi:hypothetical protein H5410_053228 [Solanum commersonii]|uniref:Uncharacterized protein n=1 Tax=Solanum commersonii TaxID=4109 RepID=A0A9J5X2Y9_SOLCO|nr:hypothetical protein H5410_053228 [Solanum commersonii]